MTNTLQRPLGRAAFTLIELLVVISIVAVLMTIGAAAAVRVMGGATKSTTRTTLQSRDSRLRQQTAKAADEARQTSVPASITQLAGGDAQRAKVLWMKSTFRQWFPTSFAEALTPAPGFNAPKPEYVAYLAQYGITSPSAVPQPYESAACLYMILRGGAQTTGEDDTSMAGATQYVPGPGGQPIPVLADAWGTPLIFSRWPVGLRPVVQGTNDPQDPTGALTSAAWQQSYGQQFSQLYGYTLPARSSNSAPPMSQNLTPVIVSAGPDRQSGYDTSGALNVVNQTQANDNMYSNNP